MTYNPVAEFRVTLTITGTNIQFNDGCSIKDHYFTNFFRFSLSEGGISRLNLPTTVSHLYYTILDTERVNVMRRSAIQADGSIRFREGLSPSPTREGILFNRHREHPIGKKMFMLLIFGRGRGRRRLLQGCEYFFSQPH